MYQMSSKGPKSFFLDKVKYMSMSGHGNLYLGLTENENENSNWSQFIENVKHHASDIISVSELIQIQILTNISTQEIREPAHIPVTIGLEKETVLPDILATLPVVICPLGAVSPEP